MHLINHKIFLRYAFLFAGLLLTACETTGLKPSIESGPKKTVEKITVRDYSNLTLEELHNLPHNKDCKKLLSKAEQELKKRPTVPVKVEAVKRLSDIIKLDAMFYLSAMAEKYPLDSSIRTFSCPKNIENVKIFYSLMQGPAYTPWNYYSYHGDVKGIDVSSPSNPGGLIEARFSDNPPKITLHLDKVQIYSLSPSHTFSNKDIDFTFNNIVLDRDKHISFDIHNKSQKNLKIFRIKITLGPYDYLVNFKSNIIKLKPGKNYSGTGVKVERNIYRWFVFDGNKSVKIIPTILYQAGSQLKNLHGEVYIRIKDLSVNQKLQ